MKFAKKMMLVPAGREEPEIQMLSELDKEMSLILKNRTLSTVEKMKYYQQALQKNLALENRLNQKGILPAFLESKLEEVIVEPKKEAESLLLSEITKVPIEKEIAEEKTPPIIDWLDIDHYKYNKRNLKRINYSE